MLAAATVVACAAPAAALPVTVTFTASNPGASALSRANQLLGLAPAEVTGSFTYDPDSAGSSVSRGNPEFAKEVLIPLSTFSIDFGGTTIGAAGTYLVSNWTGASDDPAARDLFAAFVGSLLTPVGSGQVVDFILDAPAPISTIEDPDELTLEELRRFAGAIASSFRINFFNASSGEPEFGSLVYQTVSINSLTVEAPPIPLPASAWMLLSAVGAVGVAAWRKRRAA
jgi:hypothetical protein